ncbi:MAG: hypothetical protein OXU20_23340 [Myxococcales bacterium]|nr:hypothetical protein [Myxococcales bacterium]MDD9969526.1 hypothetical protein [Myxococcales bacterium]
MSQARKTERPVFDQQVIDPAQGLGCSLQDAHLGALRIDFHDHRWHEGHIGEQVV